MSIRLQLEGTTFLDVMAPGQAGYSWEHCELIETIGKDMAAHDN